MAEKKKVVAKRKTAKTAGWEKGKLTTLTPMQMKAYAREKLEQKYSKGTRMGNKTNDTGFGKTAPRKSNPKKK